MESQSDTVWLVFTLPIQLADNYPDLWRRVQQHYQLIHIFPGTLHDGDQFGRSVHGLPDMNRDGTFDLAVGAHLDDDGGGSRGAVWILYLNADGTVNGEDKISASMILRFWLASILLTVTPRRLRRLRR